MDLLTWPVGLSLLAACVAILAASLTPYTVKQAEYAVVERFQRFARATPPGLHWRVRGLHRIAGTVNMQVRQLPVTVETRTSDNVSVSLKVAVHYAVLPSKIKEAFYLLQNPEEQIREHIRNAVLATVPSMALDEVFSQRTEIEKRITGALESVLNNFGYKIDSVLITDIILDASVRDAMNERVKAQFLQEAATAAGERDRILRVAQARAEAEAKALQGKGIADERKAIIEGLESSVAHFQQNVGGTTAQDVMTLVMLTQYFDTLAQLGKAGANTILVPHSPGALSDLTSQIRDNLIIGHRAANPKPPQT